MFLTKLLELFIGTMAGIVTGVFPGLHVNLIIPFVSAYPFLLGIAVSHTFFDFIPSLLVGVPDESSSIASLPGHRLVISGHGYEAFLLSIIGGLFGSLSLILIIPLFLLFNIPIKSIVLPALLILLLSMIMSQKKRVIALFMFCLSASLGFVIDPFSYGVLPSYFTGLFGVPTLVYSLLSDSKIPKQKIPKQLNVNFHVSLLSGLGGLLSGLLPGVTSSVSAVLFDNLFKLSDKDKVLLVGGINTVYVITSILAIWLVGSPRSGIAMAVSNVGIDVIPLLFAAVAISAFLALSVGTKLFLFFSKISTLHLNSVALFIVLSIMFVLYPKQLPLFLAASSLGLLFYSLGVSRNLGLGFIILPILSTYLCGIL